jgi:hypothetical protein
MIRAIPISTPLGMPFGHAAVSWLPSAIFTMVISSLTATVPSELQSPTQRFPGVGETGVTSGAQWHTPPRPTRQVPALLSGRRHNRPSQMSPQPTVGVGLGVFRGVGETGVASGAQWHTPPRPTRQVPALLSGRRHNRPSQMSPQPTVGVSVGGILPPWAVDSKAT